MKIPFLHHLAAPKENGLEAAMALIDLLDVKISESTLKQEIEEHPDYPSLLSIGDVLSNYGVTNITARFEKGKLTEIPTPFITMVRSDRHQLDFFTVVKMMDHYCITYLDPLKHLWITVEHKKFAEIYQQIVLLPEKSEYAGERDYVLKKQRERSKRRLLYLSVGSIPLLLFLLCITVIFKAGMTALLPVLFSVLVLTGCILGSLLFWYELDQYNPILQQICTGGRKRSCNAVINSKGAMIWGISWSVIGFSWFAGNLTFLMIGGMTTPHVLFMLAWLNIPATGYVFYSFYYQWKVIGQWCVLCIATQLVLLLQCTIIFAGNWYHLLNIGDLSIELLLRTGISFVIPFIAIRLLLPALASDKERKKYLNEFQRMKHQPEIFDLLLTKKPAVKDYPDGIGILIGNNKATNKIIKVCNPYCGPCSSAHPIMEQLLENNPDLQLQIIFTATNEENDRLAPPVKHLLAIAGKSNEGFTKQALDDWYLTEKKDYNAFAAKYPISSELLQQEKQVQAMTDWCLKNDIRQTPTFFINGYQLPDNYNINDLKYFLSPS